MITIKVTFSPEQVQTVKNIYKDITGKEPSERWIRSFLKSWVEGEEMDEDGLYEAISEELE